MKHLLKMLDLTPEEVIDILNLADQLKYEKKHGICAARRGMPAADRLRPG